MQITDKIIRQIRLVCEGASQGLLKPIKKFLLDMTTGIIQSGSVTVARVGAALEEETDLRHTHKRLEYHLLSERWEEGEATRKYLFEAVREVEWQKDVAIAFDISDISKEYAKKKKMELQCGVWDGDKDKECKGFGYWLLGVEAVWKEGKKQQPLWLEVYSHEEGGFLSEKTK